MAAGGGFKAPEAAGRVRKHNLKLDNQTVFDYITLRRRVSSVLNFLNILANLAYCLKKYTFPGKSMS